jgi:hypothetical protein
MSYSDSPRARSPPSHRTRAGHCADAPRRIRNFRRWSAGVAEGGGRRLPDRSIEAEGRRRIGCVATVRRGYVDEGPRTAAGLRFHPAEALLRRVRVEARLERGVAYSASTHPPSICSGSSYLCALLDSGDLRGYLTDQGRAFAAVTDAAPTRASSASRVPLMSGACVTTRRGWRCPYLPAIVWQLKQPKPLLVFGS